MARYFHQKIPPADDAFSTNQHVLIRRLLHEGVRLLNNQDQKTVLPDLEDIVRDMAAGLLGREVKLEDFCQLDCPNGVRVGTPSAVNEERMYDNLPPLVTYEDFESGNY